MEYFNIISGGITVRQSEEGILVNETMFLPVSIKEIIPYCHFNSCLEYRKDYEIKLVETNSLFPDVPISIHYNPNDVEDFLHTLNKYNLKSDFLPKDVLCIWDLIVNSEDLGQLKSDTRLDAENCGWICFECRWYYLTSNFAISPYDIKSMHHCSNAYAVLTYDKEMDAAEAFLETMLLINEDFSEVMPIWIANILSLLRPLVDKGKLYNIPGLFLSGPTSTGKTELALAFGILFDSPDTNSVKNFAILQSGVREFERRQKGFSDTTFILDDARKPASQSIRQSINGLIERFGRTAFSNLGIRLMPIITGEPGIFNEHLSSLRNRFIEIYLSPDKSKMRSRKELIAKIKANPIPIKTCLLHFIEFLCQNIDSQQTSRLIDRAREEFKEIYPQEEQSDRGYDNLFMHYLACKLFMHYGELSCRLSHEEAVRYSKKYSSVLMAIEDNTKLHTDEGQVKTIIRFLCNAVRQKKLLIFIPVAGRYVCQYGPGINDRYYKNNTYGHRAIIDLDLNYHGVYIKDRRRLPGYPNEKDALPVLLINLGKLLEILEYENSEYQVAHGHKALVSANKTLKHFLAQYKIIYAEKRYEKDYCNYTCKYPHWCNETLIDESVLCFNMASPYTKELADCIETALDTALPSDCLYKNTVTAVDLEEEKPYNKLVSFC